MAVAGSHLLSPQALSCPESAGSWLCAKVTVFPPPHPPGLGAACSLLGPGRVVAETGTGRVATPSWVPGGLALTVTWV